ncbi:MAG TPA: phosphotransferase, partial [Blastocatellia bacterium]|nr:phosphotransferase [Blastocatellia bacterium]
MLDAVLTQMSEMGLLRDPDRAKCNIFVRLDNVLANVFADEGQYYYLRIAQAYDLEGEYRIAQSVAGLAGRFVPQPLAFFRVGRISCIVVEGVDFRVVTRATLMNADSGEPVIRELLEYLQYVGPKRTDPSARAQVAELRVAMNERYRGTDNEALWAKVLAQTDLVSLAELPSQPQHGDFVPNNFGLRDDRLVIFDWEDYGRIDVPGFDLAVLLGSVVDFEP